MREIHLTKKDFKIDWFSGQGPGGQHRNKHQNCCRITHVETQIRAQATESRERVTNQKVAFERLAKLLIEYYYPKKSKNRHTSTEVIRNYHAVRNEVVDKASGETASYKKVLFGSDLELLIEARRNEVSGQEEA